MCQISPNSPTHTHTPAPLHLDRPDFPECGGNEEAGGHPACPKAPGREYISKGEASCSSSGLSTCVSEMRGSLGKSIVNKFSARRVGVLGFEGFRDLPFDKFERHRLSPTNTCVQMCFLFRGEASGSQPEPCEEHIIQGVSECICRRIPSVLVCEKKIMKSWSKLGLATLSQLLPCLNLSSQGWVRTTPFSPLKEG